MNQLTRDRLTGYNDFDVEDIHEKRLRVIAKRIDAVVTDKMTLSEIVRAVGDVSSVDVYNALHFCDAIESYGYRHYVPKGWIYKPTTRWNGGVKLPAREEVV